MYKYKEMKTKFLSFAMAILTAISFSSCCFTNPSYDEEVAFKQKPWIFGETGVQNKPAEGLTVYALTTSAVTFYMLPEKHDFKFDDLLSNDNTPLDVNLALYTKIQKGRTPELLRGYGENWYGQFIDPYFRTVIRELVSTYSPFDLMSNREVLSEVSQKATQKMQDYVNTLSKTAPFPIEIQRVVIDRAMPNAEQLAEMNKTAAAIQAKQTQEKKAEMETARTKAETQRAIADKAYMEQMHLNPEQYIQLKWIEVVNSKNANIDVMVGPATSMWNIKQK